MALRPVKAGRREVCVPLCNNLVRAGTWALPLAASFLPLHVDQAHEKVAVPKVFNSRAGCMVNQRVGAFRISLSLRQWRLSLVQIGPRSSLRSGLRVLPGGLPTLRLSLPSGPQWSFSNRVSNAAGKVQVLIPPGLISTCVTSHLIVYLRASG